MKKLLIALVICLVIAGCGKGVLKPAFAGEVVLKEGASFSLLDNELEQVTLLQVYKLDKAPDLLKPLSLNIGDRRYDTIVLDIGYDLGKLIEPLKIYVGKNTLLKPISPILNLVNPSVDIYGGYRKPADQNEFDYGINVVAIQFTW